MVGEDVLLAYVDFIGGLCEAVVEEMTVAALAWHQEHGQWSKVGRVNFVKTTNRRICVAPVENCKLRVGSDIYLEGSNYCVRAMIEEIQIDGSPCKIHTVGATAQEVGLRLSTDVVKNASIYVRTEVPPESTLHPSTSDAIDIGSDELSVGPEDSGEEQEGDTD